ncbi:hypothetical protein ACFSBZ_05830 [Amnibacterium flavum]|uniref:Uncharacterized protein n=1 Tax=Amnibacterium flavum TaxID=2173173 RepID=A0A2V1HNN2_9MICO|nr:hypothetical protein [Amnibacterium flavum]PVZ94011.1 hypothetical protein DDQ50_09650 [Amnibacterium flavum]
MTQHSTPRTLSTTCEHGGMCVDDRPGHALTLIRLRLALATPSRWVDAIVRSSGDDGWIELVEWQTGDVRRLWHHGPAALVGVGTPVAVHADYSVLASGSRRISVADV